VERLKGIIDKHPKRSSTASIIHGAKDSVSFHLKAKNTDEVEITLKGLSQSVSNTKVGLIEPSGFFTTETKDSWKRSLLFAFYIYISVFGSSSAISSALANLDLRIPIWFYGLIPEVTRAAIVAIPPTIVALALKKAKKLED
jgi:hypothetical protein